jgi:ZIP family zinc transporter
MFSNSDFITWGLSNPILAALLGTLFTWGVTALGSGLVFLLGKDVDRRIFNGLLGFSAGVMIAASIWSLILPALDMGGTLLEVVLGFFSGGLFLLLIDKFLPHEHIESGQFHLEGPTSSWRRSLLLVLAITLHNIPEGLAVGVSFGYAASLVDNVSGSISPEVIAAFGGAIALAIGIGIQNFPEGAAVSIPLRREGMSKRKSFLIGQFSGMVEPIAGVIGAWLVLSMTAILPFALSFAAGAMIFVVVEELIPESQMLRNTKIATIGAMIGFAVMMSLDVALG